MSTSLEARNAMQDYFYTLADWMVSKLRGRELYTCSFSGEDSDFIRFNGNRIRQAGSVKQSELSLDLIEGRHHCRGQVTLSGDAKIDRSRLDRVVARLRDQRRDVPEDPYLLYSTQVSSSEKHHSNRLPGSSDALAAITKAGEGLDLVGIYASGGVYSGFANSLGQRNWHQSFSYNLDWSVYHDTDKAVKSRHAGLEWCSDEFEAKARRAAEELDVVSKPPRTVRPGHYSVYLAPAALNEVVEMLSWGGFGLRAHRTKTTPLLRMIQDGVRLHPTLRIRENTRDGVAPDFQHAGFIRPATVELIRDGAYQDCLVSPRSAVEFGVPTNGARDAESPLSLEILPGDLHQNDVPRELGTGIYVSDLWYLNYSDRSSCRTTGTTRFATFWVESGKIWAPVNVMRFDETVYRMLGENLSGLTSEREMLLDGSTYGRRSTQSARLPGALIHDFCFTR
jgi:predicted Zn-dependent protease